MSATKFNTIFERDEAGFIYAHAPELAEVQTQGRTLDEAREMVRAAIGQALDLRRERGEPVPARAGQPQNSSKSASWNDGTSSDT